MFSSSAITQTTTRRGAFDLSIPSGHFVETEYQARQWMDYMLQAAKIRGSLGLDSETTGLVKHKDLVLLWSLSDGVQRICLDSKFLQLFKEPLLENPEVNFDFTNAPFDAHMFANTGIDLSKAGEWRDTRVQSWLFNENNLGRHGLKECIIDHFGRVRADFSDVFGTIPKPKKGEMKLTSGHLIRQAMINPTMRQSAADYASLDAYDSTTLRVYLDGLLQSIEMYPGMTLYDYYNQVEVPYTKVLWNMERRGFTIDAGHFKAMAPAMQAELTYIETEFAKAAGTVLNLASPDQLSYFFYDVLKRPVVKMTKGGAKGIKKPSTDAEVLEGWAAEGDHYARMILRHRSVAKILGTYVTGLSNHIDANYRIHTSLLQTGTVTGRLSSKEPNLQNIPRAGEDKYKIREAFIAGEHGVLMVADYEQLEMRLMAHFAECNLPVQYQKMCNAIRQNIDLHCLTVHELYGVPYEEVIAAKKAEKAFKQGKLGRELTEREMDLLLKRQQCKAAGFGIIYGIGGELLAANMTMESGVYVSPQEGKNLIKQWLGVFPTVARFIEDTKLWIKQHGYVQTILGRFRRFGDVNGMSNHDRARCERQAVNSIVQGTAADVARKAMIKAEADPVLRDLGCRMLLQVHDELIWEMPDDKAIRDTAKKRAKEIMEDPFGRPLAVPLPVELGFAETWAAAK
jgi:DNA polymerase-1